MGEILFSICMLEAVRLLNVEALCLLALANCCTLLVYVWSNASSCCTPSALPPKPDWEVVLVVSCHRSRAFVQKISKSFQVRWAGWRERQLLYSFLKSPVLRTIASPAVMSSCLGLILLVKCAYSDASRICLMTSAISRVMGSHATPILALLALVSWGVLRPYFLYRRSKNRKNIRLGLPMKSWVSAAWMSAGRAHFVLEMATWLQRR